MEKEYKYDVAISFAEEDRNVASNIAHALELRGRKAYYYPENRSDDIGHQLESRLQSIYSEEAEFAVAIFSENYFKPEKKYTRIELVAIKKRMDEEADTVYMLPVKLDKSFVLAEEPELEKLIFLEWKNNEKEIADTLCKLLGGSLTSADENVQPGSILYNYGGASMVINGSNISNITQNVINSSGDTTVITSGKEGEANNLTVNIGNPKDTRFPCINCGKVLDGSKYGEIKCEYCGFINLVRNPHVKPVKYKTLLDDKEGVEYSKVRAHINNKIRDEEYDAAYDYCLKAEKLAPGEYYTWEHFALTEFLREIYRKPLASRGSSSDIIKRIKVHIDKCKDLGITPKAYDALVIDIANRLFAIERLRLLSLFGQYGDGVGLDKWPKRSVQYLVGHLRSFENCYRLYPNPIFLQEYVVILSKPYTWMVKKTGTDEIKNVCDIAGFNPVEKRRSLIAKIKETNPEYDPGEIKEERFEIKKMEKLNINIVVKK